MKDPVLLTSLVKAGGCGSKIGPMDLRAALTSLPRAYDPNLLFGTGLGDDTGVYKLREDLAIVQTVDFFTPIVDDPYDFGAIAAANALSDCFTMGAKPVTGLVVVSFPCSLGMDVMHEICRGGMEKLQEAGGVIIGGHSVQDSEPKYGLAITGIVDPRKMITNTGATPGDALILTKKLGTGIITNLRKTRIGAATSESAISDELYQEAVDSMKALNQRAGELMAEAGATACTDVTGFGFIGCAWNVAEASGVKLEVSFEAIPKFAGMEDLALTATKGGGERNRAWVHDKVEYGPGTGEREFAMLTDAQTSGPLLISIAADRADDLVAEMKAAGVLAPAIIGRVVEGEPKIRIVR